MAETDSLPRTPNSPRSKILDLSQLIRAVLTFAGPERSNGSRPIRLCRGWRNPERFEPNDVEKGHFDGSFVERLTRLTGQANHRGRSAGPQHVGMADLVSRPAGHCYKWLAPSAPAAAPRRLRSREALLPREARRPGGPARVPVPTRRQDGRGRPRDRSQYTGR